MISILLVDDEPVLLDVMTRFLNRNDQYRTTAVQSAKEAMSVLNEGIFDIILSDYAMPELNGLDLLKHVRESGMDIPFIIFTGHGGEEIAIEALNQGADFYLQKGGDPKVQFTELTHMIERSVGAHRGIRMVRENEIKFRNFFDSASDAILILDHDTIVDLNRQAASLFEVPEEEIITRSFLDFSPERQADGSDSREELVHHINAGYAGSSIRFPWQFITPEGEIRHAEISMVTIPVRNTTYLHAIIRDVTGRMLEEERKRITGIRLSSMLTLYQMISHPLREIMEYALEQAVIITKSAFGYVAFISPDQDRLEIAAWSSSVHQMVLMSQVPYTYDLRSPSGEPLKGFITEPYIMNGPVSGEAGIVSLPDETIPVKRMISVPVTDSGKVVLLAGMYNKERPYNEDNLKQCTLLLSGLWGIIQRKRAEEELRQKNAELTDAHEEIARTRDTLQELVQKLASIAGSPDETETCLKLVADSIPAFISLHDGSGAVRYANRHWTEQMNDTGNIHASWNLLVVPGDRGKITDAFSSRFGKISSFSLKFRIRTRDGRKIRLRAIFQPLIAKDGTLSGYIGSAAETGRK